MGMIRGRLTLLIALLALLGHARAAQARELFPPGIGASGAVSAQAVDALITEVTTTREGQRLQDLFANQIPGRRLIVLALARFTVMKGGNPALLRQAVEAELGFPLPDQDAAELWPLAKSIYASAGGAFLRRLPGGPDLCIAMVGRPFENHEQFLSAIAGGSTRLLPARRDAAVAEEGVQRFLAFHEIGGHCGDPAFAPETGRDEGVEDAWAHARAELRADIFAALAMAHEDGNTEIDRLMIEVRRSYALQAAAAPERCGTAANYGIIYDTAPGIRAVLAWLEAERRSASSLSWAEIAALTDRLTEATRPSLAQFENFERRINRLRAEGSGSDPFVFARDPRHFAAEDPEDEAWITKGAEAVRALFYLAPGNEDPTPLALDCPTFHRSVVGSAGLGG
ncbi:MAG TPA: hypothetical protein VKT70_02295 [Stellaceae bacterium]|nr:hypothetical protein [Stellaceae bacterium]